MAFRNPQDDAPAESDTAALRTEFEEQSRKLQAAMRLGNLAWWEMHLPNGRVVCDARKLEMLGRDPAPFQNAHYSAFTDLLHPDDHEPAMEAMRAHLEGRAPQYVIDYRIRHADGHWVWLHDCGGITQRDPAGVPTRVTGIVVNIDERKRTETALRESEERYRNLVELAREGIWAIDPAGVTTYVNPRMAEMLGYTVGEMMGRPLMDFMDPDARRRAETYLERRRSGIGEDHDFEFLRKDGDHILTSLSTSPIQDASGAFLGALAVVSDISEQRRAEEALRQSEERFRSFVENASDIVYALSPEGIFTYVSPNWQEYMGEPEKAAIGRSFEPYVHPEDVRQCRAFFEQVLRSGQHLRGVEYRTRNREGTWSWYVSSGSPLRNDAGGIVGYVGIARDVTEKRRMESLLRSERDVAFRLANATSLSEAQTICVEAVMAMTEVDAAGLYLFEPETGDLVLARSGGLSGAFYRVGTRFPADSEQARSVATGARIHASFEDLPKPLQVAETENLRGTSIVPIIHRERVIGCLNAASRTVSTLPGETRHAVEALASQIGGVLAHLRSEQALRESEEKFRLVTETVRDVFWVSTPGAARVLYVSPAFEEIWGKPAADLYRDTSSILDSILPEDRASFLETIETHHRQCRPYITEYRIRDGSGAIRWIEEHGYPVLPEDGQAPVMAGVSRDITQRKEAEATILAKERFLDRIIDQSPFATWIADPDGTLRRANPALKTMLNVTDDQIVGVYNVLEDPLIEEQGLMPTVRKVFEEGETVHFTAHWAGAEIDKWNLAGSRTVEIEATMFPVFDAAGTMTNVVLHWIDITERRQMEERIQQMEKMDAIGQLAGGVAHDFNNQLAGILGFGDMLRERLDDPTLRRYVENMLVAARRSSDLTKQLLAFSRKQTRQAAPVDLHRIIQEVCSILDHSIDKRIHLRQRLEADARTVLGDPSQLQSALLNLGINARDAMPEGGELFFETRTVTLDRETCARRHYDLSPGQYLELLVRDTGCGMSPEVQRRIFEPFFTTKDVGKGTGMGLAAVYGTVRHHRGAISVTSTPGRGACFTLLLPVTSERVAEAVPEAADASALRGVRALVIDDEEILREMSMEMLSTLGCVPHVEADGESGVAYYREHWREVDLVILDMIMPRMSGRDAFRALREINPRARVLVASGYSAGDQAGEILKSGALGFLQKPFQQTSLIRAMLDALAAPPDGTGSDEETGTPPS